MNVQLSIRSNRKKRIASFFILLMLAGLCFTPQGLSGVVSAATQPAISSVAVMVLDTSSSMRDIDASGIAKIEAAQNAASRLLNMISSENEAISGGVNQIGLVSFSSGVTVELPLTQDIASVNTALQNLYAHDNTGMPKGLQTGIDLLQGSTGNRAIILLSDGMPNVGLQGTEDQPEVRQQVLNLAGDAGSKNICVYVIGFGTPSTSNTSGSIDEDFLKQVAAASGCGKYYTAVNAYELVSSFLKSRHEQMGDILMEKNGQISQGEKIELGAVAISQNQEALILTLDWPGSRLTPIVADPSGITVDDNYPGAKIVSSATLVSLIINNPKAGDWKVGLYGDEVPESSTYYNMLVSSRVNPNPPTATPLPTFTPAPTQTPDPGQPHTGQMGFAILLIVISGGGVAVYSMQRSIQRGRRVRATSGATQASLTWAGGPSSGQSVILRDYFMIGRGSDCGLRLTNPDVSRHHALIRSSDGMWFIQDQNTKLGTQVNGNPVRATRLQSGDRITIGGVTWIFRRQ